jgi:carboxyl-terminal processing protease
MNQKGRAKVCTFLLALLLLAVMLLSQPVGSLAAANQHRRSSQFTRIPFQDLNTTSKSLSPTDRLEVFEKVWTDINDYYYDPTFKGVNWRSIRERYQPLIKAANSDQEFYALLTRMTGELHDAHTTVLSPILRAMLRQQQRVSAGFRVSEVEGKPVIIEVTPESEAARAGMDTGMIVLAINDRPVEDRLAQVRSRINRSSSDRLDQTRVYASVFGGDFQGAGSSIKLRLQRADGSIFDVALTREVIHSLPKVIAKRLSSGYGYIALDQFTPELSKQFKDGLISLKDTAGLIIDLRFNSGGSNQGLDPVVETLLKSKTLFLRNNTRTGKPLSGLPLEIYLGADGHQVYSGRVVILTSALTASSAEMFAAGMQETGRASVVGTQTCGCVVGVRAQRELKGGGVLRVSEVLWRTPKGRKLEGEGVVPDKTVAPTISDLQRHRDVVLEQAEQVLRQFAIGRPLQNHQFMIEPKIEAIFIKSKKEFGALK